MDNYSRKLAIFQIKILLVLTITTLTGCATTKDFSSIVDLNPGNNYEVQKIAIMPVDVTLSILTAGGELEAQAEWTSNARQNIALAIQQIDQKRNSSFIKYSKPDESNKLYRTIIEHEQLHRAVGQAILFNKYQFPLPTKDKIFDWTLGNGTKAIKEYTGANYALFIYINDSYSSGGRVLLN